jgi:hypothetical protein
LLPLEAVDADNGIGAGDYRVIQLAMKFIF